MLLIKTAHGYAVKFYDCVLDTNLTNTQLTITQLATEPTHLASNHSLLL